MSIRTSIELLPEVSRVVELYECRDEAGGSGLVRVRAFASDLPGTSDPAALEQALRGLRRDRGLARDAVVTAWGLGSLHRFLRLAAGSPNDLEARAYLEVSEDLALFEDRIGKAAIVVWPATTVPGEEASQQDAWLVAVPESAIDVQLDPVVNAGFRVVRLVTPSLALVALARRQRDAAAGAVAYVALAPHATVVAVVRRGALMLSRELSSGFGDDHDDGDGGAVPPRLGSELRRTVQYFRQAFRAPVEAVVLCGDMAGLRRLTVPLGDVLGVPVRTLDSLAGIDIEHLPEPAESFRGQVAAFRIALAAGAEPDPFPALRTRAAARPRRQVAMAAGAACLGAAVLMATVWLNRPVVESPQAAPEVALTSILFSADRQVAVVNGRVVGIGDRVGSNTVFNIQPRAVVMESADGRRWTVELRDAPR